MTCLLTKLLGESGQQITLAFLPSGWISFLLLTLGPPTFSDNLTEASQKLHCICLNFENVPVPERENIVGVSSAIPANLRDNITSAILLRCMKVKQYKSRKCLKGFIP